MDNKLIQQFGTEILSYRIRTKRQKKRAQYKDFEKRLIQLHIEERALYRQRRELGWAPLEPPVQKGWKRFFVLRDDVARSRNADFFSNILEKINTFDWSYRKDFMVKRRRKGRKIYVVKRQKLLEPYEWQFDKLAFTEAEKYFFHPDYRMGKWNGPLVMQYVFREPWRFVLRVKPNMIDKVRVRDEVMEAHIQQIRNYLERNDFRKKQSKLLGVSCKWWRYQENDEYYNYNPLKNKTLETILEEAKNEVYNS